MNSMNCLGEQYVKNLNLIYYIIINSAIKSYQLLLIVNNRVMMT